MRPSQTLAIRAYYSTKMDVIFRHDYISVMSGMSSAKKNVGMFTFAIDDGMIAFE
jgi:hypothetical protein